MVNTVCENCGERVNLRRFVTNIKKGDKVLVECAGCGNEWEVELKTEKTDRKFVTN